MGELEPEIRRPQESVPAVTDARINELGNWRGKTLAKVRQNMHDAGGPTNFISGSGHISSHRVKSSRGLKRDILSTFLITCRAEALAQRFLKDGRPGRARTSDLFRGNLPPCGKITT